MRQWYPSFVSWLAPNAGFFYAGKVYYWLYIKERDKDYWQTESIIKWPEGYMNADISMSQWP